MCAGLDSGVRDGESCSAGAVHSSEFENGVKGVDAALRIGDGVGGGAGSAHSSSADVSGDGVGGMAGSAHSSGVVVGDGVGVGAGSAHNSVGGVEVGGGIIAVAVCGCTCRGLCFAKRLRLIRRSFAMRFSRVVVGGVCGVVGVTLAGCCVFGGSVCGCGVVGVTLVGCCVFGGSVCGCGWFLRLCFVNCLRWLWRSCAMSWARLSVCGGVGLLFVGVGGVVLIVTVLVGSCVWYVAIAVVLLV